MDLEAILIIGGLCIILGIVLIVPGLWWARRKAKEDPALGKKVQYTASGWISIFVMLIILFGGLSMQYLAPNSYLGKFTSAGKGRLIWASIIIVLFIAIEKILRSSGILIEKNKETKKDV